MNTELRKKQHKFMNNAVFKKTTENVRKHRNIKVITTKARRMLLVSEKIYQTKNIFLLLY